MIVVMPDPVSPGPFTPSPEQSMSGYYPAAVRGARNLVRLVPSGWPPPFRILARTVLVLVGIAFVLAAWVGITVILLVSAGASAMGRGGSGPRY